MRVGGRLKHAWNAFTNQQEEVRRPFMDAGAAYGTRPDRMRMTITNERSIVASIYVRLGVDVSAAMMRHVRLDEHNRYLEDMVSGLNECLTVEANIDQAARAFRQDMAMSLFDRGTIAIVPVETSQAPDLTGSYDIKSLRVGHITTWMPKHVKIDLYNETTGRRQEIVLPKRQVAIAENPLYSIMNEPNSTLQRLTRKLNLLDAIDEQSASGKLDLIVQLPYAVKSDQKRQEAKQRLTDIEFQLKGSQHGIAYMDATEKVIQLNRPVENNLLKQVEYLTTMLYGQLGLTPEIMLGTADEKTMINYYERTVKPIADALVESMHRTFLTKTARTQKQAVVYFMDPFKLVPMSELAELADKLARNEIVTSNEFRQILGLKPSSDPRADQLRNSNMPDDLRDAPPVFDEETRDLAPDASVLDDLEKTVNGIFESLGVEG